MTDFGLAKQFDENTRSNSLCGTVEYMSPEIIMERAMIRLQIGGVLGFYYMKCLLERLVLPSFVAFFSLQQMLLCWKFKCLLSLVTDQFIIFSSDGFCFYMQILVNWIFVGSLMSTLVDKFS